MERTEILYLAVLREFGKVRQYLAKARCFVGSRIPVSIYSRICHFNFEFIDVVWYGRDELLHRRARQEILDVLLLKESEDVMPTDHIMLNLITNLNLQYR